MSCRLFVEDTSDDTSGDGTTTLTNVEALVVLNGNRAVSLEDHFDVVTGHGAAAGVFTLERESTRLV